MSDEHSDYSDYSDDHEPCVWTKEKAMEMYDREFEDRIETIYE